MRFRMAIRSVAFVAGLGSGLGSVVLGCGEPPPDAAPASDDLRWRRPSHHHGHHDGSGIQPIAECVFRDHGHRGLTALFGYHNRSSAHVSVPVGRHNHLFGERGDEAQPERFDPGRVRGAFTARFSSAVGWRLGGRVAVANRHTRHCAPGEATTGRELARIQRHFDGLYDRAAVRHVFREAAGYRVDCVDIEQQPSLRGTGQTVRTPPAQTPPIPTTTDPTAVPPPMTSGGPDDDGAERSCPGGTIPLKRFALEDARPFGTLEAYFTHAAPQASCPATPVEYNHVTYTARTLANQGASSLFTVENPFMDPDPAHNQDHSITQLWLVRPGCACGTPNCDHTGRQSVEVGTRKRQNFTTPQFFIYHTRDNYVSLGCYNLDCVGFVQVSSTVVVGGFFNTTSGAPVAMGTRPTVKVSLTWHKDGDAGDWWLYFGIDGTSEPVGYYPRSLFSEAGLATSAERVDWGGEVHDTTGADPNAAHTRTFMGSGTNPRDGSATNFARHEGLSVLELGDADFTGPGPGIFPEIESTGLPCYDFTVISGINNQNPDNPAVTLFYGGDGANCP